MGLLSAVEKYYDRFMSSAERKTERAVEALRDDSPMHQFVGEFKRKIEFELRKVEMKMNPESKAAAEAMIRELNELLEKDTRNMSSKLPRHQYELLCDACKIVDKHVVKMSSEPGFLNRLVAGFNELMHKHFGIKDCIDVVEKTAIAKAEGKKSFSEMKDKLYLMKHVAEDKEEGMKDVIDHIESKGP